MNQIHPRQDGSARAGSGITKRDLMRKARHLASGHRPKAGAVLTPAAGCLHRRQPGKVVSWTGRTVQLCPDGRAISAMGQEEGVR